MAKSVEEKVSDKILASLNVMSLNNSMTSYFLTFASKEVQARLFDLFLHYAKRIVDNGVPDGYVSPDEASLFMHACTVVDSIESSGFSFAD